MSCLNSFKHLPGVVIHMIRNLFSRLRFKSFILNRRDKNVYGITFVADGTVGLIHENREVP